MPTQRLLLCAAAAFAASLTLASAQTFVELNESFETYNPGQLSGQGNGWIIGNPAQTLVVNAPAGTPYGDQYLRIFRDATLNGVNRVRNPVVRSFSPDGSILWSMKNNDNSATGRFSFRLPVNSGASNVWQMEIRQDLGDFRFQQLGSWQTQAFTFLTEWTDWRVDFFTSDPDPLNHRVHLTVTRQSDQVVLLSLQDLRLAQALSAPLTNLYGYDTVGLAGGNLRHDYSLDNLVTIAIPEPRTYALFLGLAVAGLLISRRRRPVL
jgi:hypothetical protein